MCAKSAKDDVSHLREQIEALVAALAAAPEDVKLHRQLREISLQRKAAGGPSIGMLRTLLPPPKDPLQRLLHLARLLAFDPANTQHMFHLLTAIEALSQARPDLDFEPARICLTRILRRANEDSWR